MSSATLNGSIVTSAVLQVPQSRVPFADVELATAAELSGSVELQILDLVFRGTILSGGTHLGKSVYRIAGGAGGWGREVSARDDANDAGVKVSKIVQDLASSAGEPLDATTLPAASAKVGVHYTRHAQPAGQALTKLLGPAGWHVGLDGVTRVGLRAQTDYQGNAVRSSYDPARGVLQLNPQGSLAGLLPGALVDGTRVVDVDVSVSKEGVRVTLWGPRLGGSRRLAAFERLVRASLPDLRYRGVFEYRVVSQTGERLNLQAVRTGAGMPDLARVDVRPGVPGVRAKHALGSRVVVAFVDADPAQPAVVGFESAGSEGFTPDELYLNDEPEMVAPGSELGRVVRYGDSIMMPVGTAALPTAIPILGSLPGATTSPLGPFPTSRVRA